jgi:hypothetical protein
MQSIKDVVSEQYAEEVGLHPIPEGEVVELRLTRANVVDPHSTRKVVTPAAHHLPGRTLITDRYDGNKKKLIINIDSFDPKPTENGGTIYVPIEKYLAFGPTGSIFLTAGQENTLWFALCHDKNGTNPLRDKGKANIFYVVNEKKEVSIKGNIFDYKALALGLIAISEEDEYVPMAQKIQKRYPHLYKFDLNADPVLLKTSLSEVADKQPVDFLVAIKEPKSYTRVIVDDLMMRNKIFFDNHEKNLRWKFRGKAKGKGDVITKLETEKGSVKSLVDYLLDPTGKGHAHYQELTKLFEEHYQIIPR